MNKVGSYTFRMTEIVGNLENIDYDKSVNTFTIKVTDLDMDGKLEIHTVTATQNAKVTKENDKYQIDVTFNNAFIPATSVPDDIEVDIVVNKTVKNTGSSTIAPKGFEFVLENTVNGEKWALESDKNGKAVFVLPFTTSDIGKTYTYKLSETDQGVAGVTYDTRVYNISISVALDSNDKLNATVTMDGKKVNTIVAKFQNTYHAEHPVAPPTGENNNITLWCIMMLISGTVCVVLVILDKKYTVEKN